MIAPAIKATLSYVPLPARFAVASVVEKGFLSGGSKEK